MLNYNDLIPLDAEDLAECGIRNAYERLLPSLREYLREPAQLEEIIDNDLPIYSVKSCGKEYRIYVPDLDEANDYSWGRATYAFFSIVNDQLNESPYRFYAINGGNDLAGMYLTEEQALDARKILSNKTDWPYLPTDTPPGYGQHH